MVMACESAGSRVMSMVTVRPFFSKALSCGMCAGAAGGAASNGMDDPKMSTGACCCCCCCCICGGGGAGDEKMSERRSTSDGPDCAARPCGAAGASDPKMSSRSSSDFSATGAAFGASNEAAGAFAVGESIPNDPSESIWEKPAAALCCCCLAARTAAASSAGILANASARGASQGASSMALYSQDRCCSSKDIDVSNDAIRSAVSAWPCAPAPRRAVSFKSAVRTYALVVELARCDLSTASKSPRISSTGRASKRTAFSSPCSDSGA
mmetsp:Transcript_477/g.1688  ORF Transcript_477/g.1688 Transcript_477/m.1688 type:complete len:268 (+) Transcript_477:383-1186(+)